MERGNWSGPMMILELSIGITLRFISCMSPSPRKLRVSTYVRFVVDGAESELGILDLIQVSRVQAVPR